jgi:hypothetical protein
VLAPDHPSDVAVVALGENGQVGDLECTLSDLVRHTHW